MNPKAHREEFASLFDQYQSCTQTAAGRVKSDFSRFFEDFAEKWINAREARKSTTPHLNVLSVFGIPRRENSHSDCLAWFLREDGEHEQGDLFMRALLKLLPSQKWPPLSDYTVERERPERLDVSAYRPNEFAVFIENKILGTPEGNGQIEGYEKKLKQFCNRNRIPPYAQVLVFLTDDGRKPKSGSDNPPIPVACLKRADVFAAFAEELDSKPEKSPLLTQLLDNYRSAIKQWS